MNQKTIIWGIVIVVIVLLGVWYFSSVYTGSPAVAPGTATTTATSTASTSAATGKAASGTPSTFKSIFTQSGNHECTFEQVGTSTRTTSVVYISGGKMRGEFRTTGTVTSANLMIYNGGYLYSWKEGAAVGKKSSISSLADLPQAIPQDLTSGAIYGTAANNVGWDCHDWLTDSSLFVLPTYVTFSK